METVSENKRRRGRPKKFNEAELVIAKYCASDPNLSERQKQNLIYRQRALCVLVEDSAYSWLCDGQKMDAAAPNAWRPGILSELGRFGDEGLIKAYAAQICELKLKTAEAVKLLRKARLGRSAKHTHLGLVRALAKTIDDYKIGRGEVAKADILRALNEIYCIVEDDD